MYVLFFDATGKPVGSMQQPDGMPLSPTMVECTAEQASNFAAYRVDLSTIPPSVAELDLATVLSNLKAVLVEAIDTRVADIYSTWTRFQQEYLLRAAAAQAFKDSDYMGAPSAWITDFARPAGLTNIAATNLILAQSAMLNGALATLAGLRMRKYEVSAASDVAGAQSAFDTIAALIDQTAAAIH